jgi:hypothetical protein
VPQRIVGAFLVFVLAMGLATGLARADTTVRVRGATGTGYTDETTNDRGTVVRRQKFSEEGKPQSDTRYDPESGAPTGNVSYEYQPGGFTEVTHTDGDGAKQKIERFDAKGRLVRRESFDDGEPTETKEWTFGAEGNLDQVSFKGPGGEVLRTFQYTWQDGKLVQVSEQDAEGRSVGQASYGSDGSLTSLRGNVGDALLELGRTVDPASHVTQGPAGETILVRHNPDGTVDVTILFADGRVGHVWLRHGEGCYLGDHCPFKDQAKAKPPEPAPEQASDPRQGMRPPRTGGLPADVPIPVPRPDQAPGSTY